MVGSFIYYTWAVNPTILMTLSEISSHQAAPAENTMKHINHFLDYMWTHPDAVIRYRVSDMILNIHSDASYLSAQKHTAEPVVTFSWAAYHAMATPLSSTAPLLSNAPSSNSLLHPQQKPNWEHSFWMHRTPKFLTTPCQTWPSTTAHPNTHPQHNNSQYCQQHHQTSTITINGNAIFLVTRWQNTKILQVLLPTRPWKLQTYINMSGHIMSTRITPPLYFQKPWNQALVKGVLKF